MNIIDMLTEFFVRSIGQTADTDEKTTALICFQVTIGFLILMGGLFWLFYRFM
jgi:hypothetical protein